MKHDYDLIVIGGGSAGLTAARLARELGLGVALAERDRIGGDCTWTGCVPSKTLLKSAKVAHEMRNAARYGLMPGGSDFKLQVDFKSVMGHVRSVVQEIYAAESPDTLEEEGIEIIAGEARFFDQSRIIADGRTLSARKFLICTGAKSVTPPIEGLQDVGYLTYETVWDQEELPRRLAVVGGGPIGCEIAQAFCRLGSQVTILEGADRLLLQEEPEVSDLIFRQLAGEGIDVRLGASVSSASQTPGGTRLSLGGGDSVVADAVLLSVGRRASLDGLGLDVTGVAYDRSGIVVDCNLRTNRNNIYAAGDCTGGYQFTHYAGFQGFMAVRNAFLPFNKKAVLERVPWATFTDPEVAHVGLTEAQAKERYGDKTLVYDWPMHRVDRAVTEGDSEGFIKLVHLPNGRLLGATVVASRAGEMVHEWSLALDQGLKISQLAHSVHVYPTFSMATQQIAARMTMDRMSGGRKGRVLRKLAKVMR